MHFLFLPRSKFHFQIRRIQLCFEFWKMCGQYKMRKNKIENWVVAWNEREKQN